MALSLSLLSPSLSRLVCALDFSGATAERGGDPFFPTPLIPATTILSVCAPNPFSLSPSLSRPVCALDYDL